MESLSNHFRGLRVVAARYTGVYLPLFISLYFQFDIQSHHVSFPFGIQSRIFILAFRVTFSILTFRVAFSVSTFRAVIASQFRRSESSSLLNFGVQSHHRFSVLAFRATIASQFPRLKPQSLLSFGIQSHHRFSISAFRAISSGVRSHHCLS